MKLSIIVAALALAPVCTWADAAPAAAQPQPQTAVKKTLTRAEYEAYRYKKTGGDLVKKGSFLGKVALVNAQGRLTNADLESVARLFKSQTECNFVAESGKQELAKPYCKSLVAMKDSLKASIIMAVIDDPEAPQMILAPEDHWGFINVARLVDDLPGESAKQKFFAPRGRKLLIKATSLMCGGGSSTFPGNVMNVATVRALDPINEQIPVDRVAAHQRYLNDIGVTKAERVTYKRACREGWAPQPTNDVQKAIWDKVHELPSKPIVIEPETKTQKK